MDVLPDLLPSMVAGAVEQNNRLRSPAWRLLIELRGQVLQERQQHLLVGVRLSQGEVDPAVGVQRCDQGNPRDDRLQCSGGSSVSWAPDLAQERRLVEPGLVTVEDALPCHEQWQHLQRVLLPKHEAALRVALDGDLLRNSVAEAKVLPQHAPNFIVLHLEVGVLVHSDHDRVRILNWHAPLKHLLRCFLDGFPGFPGPLLLNQEFQLLLGLTDGLPDEPTHQCFGDSVELRDVPLMHVLLGVQPDDLRPDLGGQLLSVSLLEVPSQSSLCSPPFLELPLR